MWPSQALQASSCCLGCNRASRSAPRAPLSRDYGRTRTNTLEFPQPKPGPVASIEPVRLFLSAGGSVEWNGQALCLQELQARFEAAAKAAGVDTMQQPKLVLSADEGADYQLLGRVLAHASNAGLVRIELSGSD